MNAQKLKEIADRTNQKRKEQRMQEEKDRQASKRKIEEEELALVLLELPEKIAAAARNGDYAMNAGIRALDADAITIVGVLNWCDMQGLASKITATSVEASDSSQFDYTSYSVVISWK